MIVKKDTNPHLPQVQDKDELTMKKLKTEGGDKDGIKDAEVFALSMDLSRQILMSLSLHLFEWSLKDNYRLGGSLL